MKQIYLDYNATTPIDASVVEAMMPFFQTHFGNPSSTHSVGRAAREAIEDARAKVSALIGCDRDEVIFTGGGTEASNMAIKGVMFAGGEPGGHMITTAIEHPATIEPARFVERLGCELTVVGCDENGVVDPQAIADAIRPDTRLVSVMHANNEIGTIQPIREIAEICHEKSVVVHADASQSIGKIPAFVDQLDVDLMTVAGHKFYAPKGIGVLFVREGLDIESLLHGAGHEGGLRAGTENTPYIVGLGRAAFLAASLLDESSGISATLRDKFWKTISSNVPRAVAHGMQAERLPNTLSIAFPNVSGAEMLSRVPEVCASLGAACHSSGEHRSGTLHAMGVDQDLMRGTIRFSFGRSSNAEEAERAAMLMVDAWETLKS
ncbi:cysteine desulfurase family protein [Mariniblastus fucicola]|uniref:cysteine desulfurase n=1 Tax=Mariniblastus fucicola TaxID=980251 RepID=A0A5B9PCF2_9BACT|nr:cysteine desulfurase family protein [Mariniblastus fucicola]QEG22740.1 Cysteine desulfurase [Mariniblastus fucicola]